MCKNKCSNHCYFKIFLDKKHLHMCRETHIHLKLVENVFPCYVKKNYLLYFFGNHLLVLYL